MATAGTLRIFLTANAGGLQKGMHHGEAALESFQHHAEHMKHVVVEALAVVGVALGAEAFKHWIETSMEAVVQTAHLADRLGVTTEAITGLQYAASQFGI